MTNRQIADILRELSICYSMDGVSFKPAAYDRAADALTDSATECTALYKEGGRKNLKTIPGIGEGISEHIELLLTKGDFPEYKACKKRYPIDLLGLTSIDDVGPKRAKLLYQKLRVKTVEDLEKVALAGKVGKLTGFGPKTEQNILKGVARRKQSGGRQIMGHVLPIAERIVAEIRTVKGVKRAEVAGSLRRRQETIGDMDILVTTSAPEKVAALVSKLSDVAEVLEHGHTKTVLRLTNGMQADVRFIPDASFGAALQYFTGNKDHNVVIRKMALAKKLTLNEYGLWRLPKKGKAKETLIAARTEEEVYKALGLPYIEPELRTETGEIEAAKAGKLPKLIEYGSLRGDLQTQTKWTDGAASIEEMAEAARKSGLEYMAVTDHTQSLAMMGLDEKDIARQGKEIDKLNAAYKKSGTKFTILKGSEVNILKDGSLDISDEALSKLDSVGIAVHSHFNLSREEQTARVIKAMQNPHADILFHPTGRQIGKRDPFDIDMEAVLKAAKATGTAVEIDAYPERSDLKDVHVRMAVELGVKLTIDTDAHHPSHLAFRDFGVAIARRGWATSKDVLNTLPLKELLKWLQTPKAKRR